MHLVCPHQACTISIIFAYDMEHRKFGLFGQWVSSCWSCSQVWDGNETKTSVLFSCQDDVFKASVWTIWEGHGHPTQFLHLELFAGCLRKRHTRGRMNQRHLKASRILTVQAGQLEFKAVLGATSNCMHNLLHVHCKDWLAHWFAGSFHPESYIKCVHIKQNGCTTIANDLVHSHKMGRTRKGTTKVLDIKRSARSFLTRQGQSQVILICLHWNHWFGSWFLGLVRAKWKIALQKFLPRKRTPKSVPIKHAPQSSSLPMTWSTGNLHFSDNGSAAVGLAPKFEMGMKQKHHFCSLVRMMCPKPLCEPSGKDMAILHNFSILNFLQAVWGSDTLMAG